MDTKRALLIVNNRARRGAQDLDIVQDTLRHSGIESLVFSFDHVHQLKGAIRRHCRHVDMVVVGGGDGTLNAAVEPVLDAGLTLGVIPLGTANDLARTLQIPPEPDRAAHVIAAGRIKRIDLGWVNHKHFFNVASIGLAVNVTATLTRAMKKRWGALAYPLSILNAYRSIRPFKARIICDGRSHRLKSIQIAIGNGRHYGGGMSIRQDAAIDDQYLNLYSLSPKPLWRLAKSAPAIIKGTMEQDDLVRLMDGQEIRVMTNRPMSVSTDGEITARTPALFRVRKAILPVLVP